MSFPRKALFAPSQPEARAILRAFGLPKEEWSGFGIGAATTGRQFDRIIVKMPLNPTAREIEHLMILHTRLSPTGGIFIITPSLSKSEEYVPHPPQE